MTLPIRRIATGPRSGQEEYPVWEMKHEYVWEDSVVTLEGGWEPFSTCKNPDSECVLVSYRRQFYPSDRKKATKVDDEPLWKREGLPDPRLAPLRENKNGLF